MKKVQEQSVTFTEDGIDLDWAYQTALKNLQGMYEHRRIAVEMTAQPVLPSQIATLDPQDYTPPLKTVTDYVEVLLDDDKAREKLVEEWEKRHGEKVFRVRQNIYCRFERLYQRVINNWVPIFVDISPQDMSPLPCVGMRFQPGAFETLKRIVIGDPITLRREPDNPHDPNAIAMYYQGEKLGYVPRNLARIVAPRLDDERNEYTAFVMNVGEKRLVVQLFKVRTV